MEFKIGTKVFPCAAAYSLGGMAKLLAEMEAAGLPYCYVVNVINLGEKKAVVVSIEKDNASGWFFPETSFQRYQEKNEDDLD